MKQLLIAVFLLASITSIAQITTTIAKKVISLKMPKNAEDDMSGKRGASVVWHPVQKKYYAAMAGNAAYPLGIYDAKGKLLSDPDMATLQDARGLWYNPKTKRIEANGYDKVGFFYYNINTKGLVTGYDIILEGMNQPSEQCVGAYNSKTNEVLFYTEGKLVSRNTESAILSDTEYPIYFGRTVKDGIDLEADLTVTPEGYNTTTPIFTGIANAEVGLLNSDKKQIELYSLKTGFLTKIVKLPKDVPAEENFSFAYTNGMYWLFTIETRNWVGYK